MVKILVYSECIKMHTLNQDQMHVDKNAIESKHDLPVYPNIDANEHQ